MDFSWFDTGFTDFSLSCEPSDRINNPSELLDSDSEESDSASNPLTQTPTSLSNEEISHVPQSNTEFDAESLKYCRYCGVPHMPQHSFDIIQKNCALKPRKIRLNSRTLPLEIFSNSILQNQDFHYEPMSVDSNEIPIEEEIFVNSDSPDAVKMVAAGVQLLDLTHFLPTEGTSLLIATATKCFLRSLLLKSIEQIPPSNSRAALDQKLPSVLTPLHVFQAITGETIQASTTAVDSNRLDNLKNLDFLSNAYFSASNSAKQPQ